MYAVGADPVGTDWHRALRAVAPGLMFATGCDDVALARAEATLRVRFANELKSFLAATDGFYDPENQHHYAWSLETIVRENVDAWHDERLALDRDLLAFGDDGAGDWFCLPAVPGPTASVYHWSWIGKERRMVAASLSEFWTGWYGGSILV